MTVIPKPAVELLVDERLVQNAELVRQIEAGLLYLEQFYDRTAPPKAVRVRPIDPTGESVELAMTDAPADPEAWVKRLAKRRWFGNPANRDVTVLQLFSDLLGERTKASHAQTSRLWIEYCAQAEEPEHAAADAR